MNTSTETSAIQAAKAAPTADLLVTTNATAVVGSVAVVASALTSQAAQAAVPSDNLTPEQKTYYDGWRLLTQATFGPRPTDLDRDPASTTATAKVLWTKGAAAWLNDQFLKQPKDSTYNLAINNEGAWPLTGTDAETVKVGASTTISAIWEQFLSGPDQLRQRVAFALSEIFVVSLRTGFNLDQRTLSVAAFHDMLVKNAFVNFRTLIKDVCLHPAMGDFLSHLFNNRPSFTNQFDPVTGRYTPDRVPDQNFARELMQLFTIGLVQLNMDGTSVLVDGKEVETYKQHDIELLSYVFTGWQYDLDESTIPANHKPLFNYAWVSDGVTNAVSVTSEQKRNIYWPPMRKPMKQLGGHSAHATVDDFSKGFGYTPLTFLGQPFTPTGNATQDLDQALKILMAHQNVAPFIARQMIQRLVTSNPSPAYVRRAATQFKSSNYSMQTLVQAILLDAEARDIKRVLDTTSGLSFGKLREPVLRATAALRAMSCHAHKHFTVAKTTPAVAKDVYIFGYSFRSTTDGFSEAVVNPGQGPYQAPSVFNYFRPGYVVPTSGIKAPELQASSPVEVTTYVDFIEALLMAGGCGWLGSLDGAVAGTYKPAEFNFPAINTVPYAYTPWRFGVYIKLQDELSNLDAGMSKPVGQRFDAFVNGLNNKFLGGVMSSSMKTLLQGVLGRHFGVDGSNLNASVSSYDKGLAIRQCLLLVLVSAEFVVQK